MEFFGREVSHEGLLPETTDSHDSYSNELFLSRLAYAKESGQLIGVLFEPEQTGSHKFYRCKVVSEFGYRIEHLPVEVVGRLLRLVQGPLPSDEFDYYTPVVDFLREKFGDLLVKGTCAGWDSTTRSVPPVNIFQWRRRLLDNFFHDPNFPFLQQVRALFRSGLVQWNHLSIVVANEMPFFLNAVKTTPHLRARRIDQRVLFQCFNKSGFPLATLTESGFMIRPRFSHYDHFYNHAFFTPPCSRGAHEVLACWGMSDPLGDFVGGYGCDGLACRCSCHEVYRQTLYCTEEYLAEKISLFTGRPFLSRVSSLQYELVFPTLEVQGELFDLYA